MDEFTTVNPVTDSICFHIQNNFMEVVQNDNNRLVLHF